MKEIEQIDKDRIEIVGQKEQPKETKIVGRMKKIKGLTLYQLDTKSGVISKAKVVSDTADFKNPNRKIGKAKFEENCLYLQALNIKNAKRKFEKLVDKIIASSK